MVSINKYEYFYVQSENSIMRNSDEQKTKQKLKDKLNHFDNLINRSSKMNLKNVTKENLGIYAVNSLLAVTKDLKLENKKYFEEELRRRKIFKYIKIRNFKQLLKKIILRIKY